MKPYVSLFFSGLASAGVLVDRAKAVSRCPGYKASNIKTSAAGLTADLTLAGEACNAYGDDVKHLVLDVSYETDNRLHVKIQDADNQVYQVPESVFPRPSKPPASSPSRADLQFDYTASPFSFSIRRRDTHEVLFDTSAASLVFESQYLRLRTKLPHDPYLYGLGEHSDPLRLNTTNYTRTMWNQDSYGVPEGANLYGTQPFYLEHRAAGSHGVFLLNSNGMDVVIDKAADGSQFLEYNTLGGVLDFWFLAGNTPTKVAQQYTEIAGLPAMQPYWGLGFHQCRYGYQDVFEVAEVVHNYSMAGIPLETMWTDIDYMDRRRVFSLDPERFPLAKMRALVSHLHARGQHYVVMVDPAVAYQDYAALAEGLEQDVFLKRDNGSVWLGVVWPGVAVFPDWFSRNAQAYWNAMFGSFFHKDTGIDIDALWIDMNEPSNFPCDFPCDDPYAAARGYPPPAPPVRSPPRPLPGWPCVLQPAGAECKRSETEAGPRTDDILAPPPGVAAPLRINKHKQSLAVKARADPPGDRKGLPNRNLLYPRYAIHNKAAHDSSWNADKGGISNHTINTDVRHANGLAMYDTHNIYGAMMSAASREAMLSRRPSQRPMIITRSTFAGAGSKVGHWLGDNLSTWDMYRNSIRSMLAFTAIYGFTTVGADVCGFGANTTEELCARWASLGAFSTFYRNHNAEGQVAQEFYRWPSVARSARAAIAIRYRLLDYIYTAMRRASVDGTPALQPVMYVYPDDRATWTLELQYFYGPGLLVAPVTRQGATSVDVYLPDDLFFDWYSHRPVRGGATTHSFGPVDTDAIPLFIRAGVVVAARVNAAYTTAELRRQDFELLVPVDGPGGEARGELYLDDGVSIQQQGKYSLIEFQYKDGRLSFDGVFDYKGPARVARITFLGLGCTPEQGRTNHTFAGDNTYSRSVDVDLSLNRATTYEAGN
ncbi:alpha-glucosidase [Metarhizium rileyi]|uniref:Alpha-glucosidase n=1 Tax=Metarhizium rileyi (strain RCEF 4871) TaxID=1649241 RepID=A0A162JMF5_METRR|nr:alpha-glucosidase [Metarhizium rileyi RCEF 4871]